MLVSTMNDAEKRHFRILLRDFSDDVLFQLAETVTKKRVSVTCCKDAIDAIISYSNSAAELLSRKKVNRDILYQYLSRNNVTLSLNSTKEEIVVKILDFWRQDEKKHSVGQGGGSKKHSSASKIQKTASEPVMPSSVTPVLKTGGNLASAATSTFTPASNNTPSSNVTYNFVQVNNYNTFPSTTYTGNDSNALYNQGTTCTQSADSTPSDLQFLGEKFVTWFYENLNTLNPKLGKLPQDFGSHHFMDDAEMCLLVITSEIRNETFRGSRSVSERHLAFVRDEQILFNPNICREGVFVRSSPHGLTLVAVCGTVHRENQCLGCFEQMFGLVRDPFVENNWKIKLTKLKLQTREVSSVPRLVDKSTAEIEDLLSV